MKHADSRLHTLIGKIGIETGQVRRHDQALVAEHRIRQTVNEKVLVFTHLQFRLAAGYKQGHGKSLCRQLAFGLYKYLLYTRHGCQPDFTQHTGIRGHGAPSKHRQALRHHGVLNSLPLRRALLCIGAEKHLAHRVLIPQGLIE